MERDSVDLLRSPGSGAPLVFQRQEDGEFLHDQIGRLYPIQDGVVRFVDDEDFAESFGYQWNRFDVKQAEEDERTFTLKTGVPLVELKGLTVLDAGCGGGRYSRVAGEHGAVVFGVDRSRSVDKARELTAHLPTVTLCQADLTDLPFAEECFDLVFSIGVLHHGPDPKRSFDSIARRVKPGGRLSVWVYRRNWWFQEVLNNAARAAARAMPRSALMACCRFGALLGGVPVLNQTLNKVLNFSNHPVWELRVCDTFDWYSPRYQQHHTVEEVYEWFKESGFVEIRELPPAKNGKLYETAFRHGFIIGSGVNVTGIRRSDPAAK